mgnify:CR=1 FL=1
MTTPSASQSKTSPLVIRSAIVASLGGLLFGFDTAVISGAEEKLKALYALSSFGEGMIVAIATIGTILGAIVAGRLADHFGRKPVLFWIGILFGVGALATALAPTPDLVAGAGGAMTASSSMPIAFFMVFRFLGGVGVGMSSVVAPIYTAEIAPARVRGRLVGLVQFNIVFGILLAYASNAIIREIAHEEVAWRWMLGVMAVPAVFFLLFLMAVPETPRWLFAHRREDEARAISARLTNSAEESEEQMKEIADQLAEDRAAGHVPFFTRRYRKVILMAFCIAMFNQLSGINAILYYAPKVMKLAGGEAIFGAAFPYIASVVVGLMNLIATMAALTVIDKLGRRQLMIVGSIGYLVSLGFLAGMMFAYEAGAVTGSAAVWLVLIGLLGFIASHAFGQGSVIWVFISEIFPNRVRARGQSLGSLTHWTFAFITTYAFPVLTDKLGGGFAFGIFFLCMVGQLFWVLKVMPETKGIPLEAMEEKLGLSDD